jgi:hypothetical protein
MKSKLLNILLFCCVILLSGCANPYILRRQDKNLVLSPDQGVVLFTAQVSTGNYRPFQYTIQEINQYKFYAKLNKYIIPCVPENYSNGNVLVFGLKLPKGIYKLDTFSGILGGFFGYQHLLAAGSLFDVTPGKITYAGRLIFNWNSYAFSQLNSVKNEFEADIELAKRSFPVLRGKEISQDLSY